jgi:ABC-2 type transport system permease protein
MFPMAGASLWMRVLMRANPLTYGVEALRDLFYPASGAGESLRFSLAILVLFAGLLFSLSFIMVNRRTTKPSP